MRPRVLGRFGSAVLVLALACESRAGSDDDGDLLEGVEIDLLHAMAIAADEVPDGVTLDAELIAEAGGGASYDIDRHVGSETREVVIDAATGDARTRIDPDDQADGIEEAAALAASSVGLTLAKAVEIAADAADGEPVSVELELDNGTVQVALLDDGATRVVSIDLDLGTVIETDGMMAEGG